MQIARAAIIYLLLFVDGQEKGVENSTVRYSPLTVRSIPVDEKLRYRPRDF